MHAVIDGLLALGLIFAGLWIWSLRSSLSRDQAEAERLSKLAEREARLQRKGERLVCLSCGKLFRGPLPPEGCPNCHLAAFVVPESEQTIVGNKKNGKEG